MQFVILYFAGENTGSIHGEVLRLLFITELRTWPPQPFSLSRCLKWEKYLTLIWLFSGFSFNLKLLGYVNCAWSWSLNSLHHFNNHTVVSEHINTFYDNI